MGTGSPGLPGRDSVFLVFLFWTYLAGFHPAAHGTEKYMDFGFMQAMMRSTTLPAQDMWYAGKPFNYYYGGQYLAVFLTKLTGTNVEVTYNLMRTMVAAFAFLLPFSLVRQMLKDKLRTGREWSFCLGGILAGMAVSMSGNLHYIIYGIILRLLKIKTDYWFPSSTRYIGFDPAVTGDETIHEFPSYSFCSGRSSCPCDQCLSGPDGTGNPLFLDEDKLRKKLEAERESDSLGCFWECSFFSIHGIL